MKDVEQRLKEEAERIETELPGTATLLRAAEAEIHRLRQHAAQAAAIIKTSRRYQDRVALTHLYVIAPPDGP